MAIILNLPVELLLHISQQLYSIDEVFQFSRCSRRLHSIIDDEKNMIIILRSIIRHSTWHQSDARLCRFIDTAHSLSFKTSGSVSPQHEAPGLLRKAFYAQDEDMKSRHISIIVRRWKDIKSLYIQGFVCERLVCSKLRNKTLAQTEFDRMNCLGSFYGEKCRYGGRSLSRKPSTFTAFYQRCTGLWLASEVEELMGSFWDIR